MRRLHRHGGRPRHQVVQRAGRADGQRRDHHHRGHRRSRRHHAPDAGGLQGMPRPAMRLLHAGHGDERHRPLHPLPELERNRDPRAARRQHVPLHRLPEHRQGGAGRRRGDGRSPEVEDHRNGLRSTTWAHPTLPTCRTSARP
ncbi:hypothetical protein VARIO8X_100223 [Burkholderiales bacterium 8X]|nr:hypothetical protein VARIO8X_100223 [Burkholderiales bacterium 8X]